MSYINRNKRNNKPLVVKEIILPSNEECNFKKTYFSRDIGIVSKISREQFEEIRRKPGANTGTYGPPDSRAINTLLVLEKKPLENYFEGTREYKNTKKKKRLKSVLEWTPEPYRKPYFDFREDRPPEISSSPKPVEAITKEEKIAQKKIALKIYKYEKMKEHKERNNQMKQRLAEEKYIKEQETLTNKWLGIFEKKMKSKQEVDCGFFSYQEPFREPRCSYKNDISFTSREFQSRPCQAETLRKTTETLNKIFEENSDEETFKLNDIPEDFEEDFLMKLMLSDKNS